MQPDEAGIIESASSNDPHRPGLGKFLVEECAWLLAAFAVTILVATFLQGRGGWLAAAAPGVALYGLHGLVGLHVIRTEGQKLARWFGLDRRAVLWGAAGGATLLAFNGLYGLALEALGIVPPDVAELLRGLLPEAALVLWAVLLAAMVEEMYFRGRLQDAFTPRLGPGGAGLICSSAFAAIHGIPAFLPAYLAFGYALLFLRRRTGGLIAPIIAHTINNAFALIQWDT